MQDLVLSCLESRVEQNTNLYARFLLAPFVKGHALTIATALRRALLSSVESIGISELYIQGITHEFSAIEGVRESVLELSLNFQQIVLTQRKNNYKTFNKNFISLSTKGFEQSGQVGYLQVQGPRVVYANDLKLPLGVECVDPTQYIATLSSKGMLVIKFLIAKTGVVPASEKVNFSKKPFPFSKTSKPIAHLDVPLPCPFGGLVAGARARKIKCTTQSNLYPEGIAPASRCVRPPFMPHFCANGGYPITFIQRGKGLRKRGKGVKEWTKKLQGRWNSPRMYRQLESNTTRFALAENLRGDLKKQAFALLPVPFLARAPFSVAPLDSQGARQKSSSTTSTKGEEIFTAPNILKAKKNTSFTISHRNKSQVFQSDACFRNIIPLDLSVTPVKQVNFIVENDNEAIHLYDEIRERIVLEVWTNGSIHPRQAIHEAALSLLDTFSSFRTLFQYNSLCRFKASKNPMSLQDK